MFDIRPLDSSSLGALARTVDDTLRAILEALRAPRQEVMLSPLGAAPSKPRDGMLVYADGVNWNPGAGAGIYARQAGAWVKL